MNWKLQAMGIERKKYLFDGTLMSLQNCWQNFWAITLKNAATATLTRSVFKCSILRAEVPCFSTSLRSTLDKLTYSETIIILFTDIKSSSFIMVFQKKFFFHFKTNIHQKKFIFNLIFPLEKNAEIQ